MHKCFDAQYCFACFNVCRFWVKTRCRNFEFDKKNTTFVAINKYKTHSAIE